jgi:hypothetical protein
MLTGGCFCGAIRYKAEGEPFHATLCHCADCRRVAGAPAVAWFSVQFADYRVVAGKPKVFASSDHGRRSFCVDCGTGLTFQSTATSDEIDVNLCSLDDPDALPPTDQTRTAARLRWWDALTRIPGHAGPRPKS